ncbi:MAG TPA: hypothetical protein VF594_03195 [Rubricoccaceae bacterium]|jgi:hypothetical protein
MPRLVRLAALLVLPLAGCTSTLAIDATDAVAVARVEAAVVSRQADITLASGVLYRGRIAFVRVDSTAWEEDAGAFAVQTSTIRSLVIDTRESAPRLGRVVGAPIVFGLCAVAFADAGFELSFLLGAICAPIGSFVGVLGGLAGSSRAVYVFAEADATTADGDAP